MAYAGLISADAISLGIFSVGALSVGCFSSGALAIGHYAAIGDNARAMIAIEKNEATGSIYQHIGKASSADIDFIFAWLDENTPAIFSWAKEMFKSIIRK